MPFVHAALFIFDSLVQLTIAVVLINAVVSWLIAFDVLNVRNANVYRIVKALDGLTEPLLRPIRRFMPNLGGVDLSPIILILLLEALSILVHDALSRAVYG